MGDMVRAKLWQEFRDELRRLYVRIEAADDQARLTRDLRDFEDMAQALFNVRPTTPRQRTTSDSPDKR